MQPTHTVYMQPRPTDEAIAEARRFIPEGDLSVSGTFTDEDGDRFMFVSLTGPTFDEALAKARITVEAQHLRAGDVVIEGGRFPVVEVLSPLTDLGETLVLLELTSGRQVEWLWEPTHSLTVER